MKVRPKHRMSGHPPGEKKPPKNPIFAKTHIMGLAKSCLKLMAAHEVKEPRRIESKDSASSLHAPLDIAYLKTPGSNALSGVLMDMFKGNEYRFPLSTILNISSSGTGTVSSVVNVSTLASNPEFISLTGVFSEFFVVSMEVLFQPVSRYNGPIGSAPATTATSLPIGMASLQHGITAYSNLTNMSENYQFAWANTSDPFKYMWRNIEDPRSTVLTNSSGISQGWELTGNVGSYAGTIQFLSQVAPPALPVSTQFGVFAVRYEILFRTRV